MKLANMFITSLTCTGIFILTLTENVTYSPPALGKQASSSSKANAIVAPLQSIIPEARKSPSPVYLPTWLPPANIGKCADIYLGEKYNPGVEDWCEIDLAYERPICNANTAFYICIGKGVPHITKRKVILANGWVGYLQSPGNFHEIQWANGKYYYAMGLPGVSNEELIKTARLLVSVSH